MANTITVNVVGDIKNISNGIDNVNTKLTGMEKVTGKVSGFMKSAAGAVATAWAGGQIVNGVKAVVGAASDLNETVSKTNTIFGDSAGGILAWGDSAAKSLGLPKQAALDGVSTFGNFFQQIGLGAEQTSSLSKEFVQAAVDLGSFHNAAAPDVMDALASATRGEYDALQRYIPTINAAAVEQKALEMSGKELASQLTDQDKALATHALVMGGMGAAAGDFARTSDSLANQQKILTAEWENAKAQLGTALLPALTAVGSWMISEGIPAIKEFAGWFKDNLVPPLKEVGGVLQDTVVPALQTFGNWFANNIGVVAAFAAVFGALFLVQQAHAAFMAVQAVGGLVAYIAQMGIVQAATKTWAAVQWLLNAAMMANPIGLVIIAIVALIAILVIAWKNSETFRNIVIGAWNAVKDAASKVWGWIKDFVSAAFKFILDAWTKYTPLGIIVSNWNSIKSAVSNAVESIKSWVSNAWNNVKNATTSAWNSVKSSIESVWNGIKSSVSNAISSVVSTVSGIRGSITGIFSGAASWLVQAGKNILQGLVNGITNMIGTVKSKLQGLTSLIPSWKGPAQRDKKLLFNAGTLIMEGLVNGIESQRKYLRAELQSVTAMISNTDVGVVGGGYLGTPTLSRATLIGGGGTAINVTVNVPPTADKASIGREIKSALDEWVRVSG